VTFCDTCFGLPVRTPTSVARFSGTLCALAAVIITSSCSDDRAVAPTPSSWQQPAGEGLPAPECPPQESVLRCAP
jgi:hypothetical protein